MLDSHLPLGAILLLLVVGCYSEPKSYEDCILLNVKPSMSEAAAQAVTQACLAKFPQSSPKIVDLSQLSVLLLTGKAGVQFGDHFGGTIYNGLGDVTIRQLEIEITTTSDNKPYKHTYRTDVTIPPETAGSFDFKIVPGDVGADYSWSISAARGVFLSNENGGE